MDGVIKCYDAPAWFRTEDLLITNQESKLKKINTINVN